MRRLDPSRRPYAAAALAPVLLGTALLVSGCSSSSAHRASAATDDRESTRGAVLKPDAEGRSQHELLVVKGATISALAAIGPRLVWTQLVGPEERRTPGLVDWNRATGHPRALAGDAVPALGVAATPSTVVYVRDASGQDEVVTMPAGGGARTVIGQNLATPIAVRGDRVAWAEQTSTQQRVVVRDLATASSWVAASFPRCVTASRCYRIDTVALSDDGVVFNRSAIGPQPSLVVRRRFTRGAAETYAVPHDPQPDIAPASSGAFFYELGRGWKRWDFSSAQPTATPLRSVKPWLLEFDHGAMLLETGPTCSPQLIVRRPGARDIVTKPPADVPRAARTGPTGTPCRLMTTYDWNARRLLVAWTLTTEETIATHAERAPVAVVTATPLPPPS